MMYSLQRRTLVIRGGLDGREEIINNLRYKILALEMYPSLACPNLSTLELGTGGKSRVPDDPFPGSFDRAAVPCPLDRGFDRRSPSLSLLAATPAFLHPEDLPFLFLPGRALSALTIMGMSVVSTSLRPRRRGSVYETLHALRYSWRTAGPDTLQCASDMAFVQNTWKYRSGTCETGLLVNLCGDAAGRHAYTR